MDTDALPPDESLLRRFLLGELPPDDLERVGAYIDKHPELASTLNALKATDTLLDSLRDAPAAEVPETPELAELISRATQLPAGESASEAGQATLTAAGPDTPDEAPTADPVDVGLAGVLAPPDRPGDLGRLGDYRVLRVLGRGGMGAVFEAEDPQLGRHVALKVMLPALAANPVAKRRFLQEAKTAAAVDHDHIVPIYHVVEDRGVPFLAMPLLQGESLDDRLKARRPLATADVLTIGRQVAEGLAAAHAAGLIHRDIKPSNVWLERTADGAFKRVRILDFGLARLAREAGDALTHSGAILGTPAYMAPEQAAGKPVDSRADLFSLGCVLYQMATGRRPFAGTDTFAILTALATETPTSVRAVNPDVPKPLSDLIDRLLTKDPAGRPPSAREVADELARLTGRPSAGSETHIAAPQVVVVAPPAEAPADVWSEVADATEAEVAPPEPRRKVGRGVWVAVAAAVLLPLGLLAYYGQTVVRIVTDKGELVVEVDDPTIEVVVKQDGAVIVDKSKGREFVIRAGDKGEVEFYDPDTGAKAFTKSFTLIRGDKTRVKATLKEIADARPKPSPAGAANPLAADERKALEWVLSVGGRFRTYKDGQLRTIGPGERVPEGPVPLHDLLLDGCKQVADADIENLRPITLLPDVFSGISLKHTAIGNAGLARLATFPGFARIRGISLENTGVTDAGLEHIKGFPLLTFVELQGTRVTDAGLEHLRGLQLGQLHLSNCKGVTGSGFVHLRGMTTLRSLSIGGCPILGANLAHLRGLPLDAIGLSGCLGVGDEGLEHVGELVTLTDLDLNTQAGGPGVTDKGVAKLHKLTKLRFLDLKYNTPGVTDASLATIARFTELVHLKLVGTPVTDAGLERLAGLQKLEFLHLGGTKVTKAGVEKLAAALPNCKIEWDGGVIDPSAPPPVAPLTADQRKAVEWLLTNGGGLTIKVGGEERWVKAGDPLPARPFALWYVGFTNAERIDDAAVENFRHFPRCDGYMALTGTRVTDAGLARLATFPVAEHLTGLMLAGSRGVTDAGLAHLAGFPTLMWVDVTRTAVTDAGLEKLAGMKKLMMVKAGGAVTTEAGVRKLAAARPDLRVEWNGRPLAARPSPPGPPPAPLTADQRASLEWVRKAGGKVVVATADGAERELKAGEAIPAGPVTVLRIVFHRVEGIDDAALDNLKSLPPVTDLFNLSYTRVTDAGLAKLPEIPGLTAVADLALTGLRVTGAGLEHVRKLPRLRVLGLMNTDVTDAGLEHLKGTDLQTLGLTNCGGVTDAGLEHLAGCKDLTTLYLRGTKVTKEGVARLAAALPACEITWDGGPIRPKPPGPPAPGPLTAEQRKAVEWVLKAGGKVKVVSAGAVRELNRGDAIPDGPAAVRDVFLAGLKDIDDAALDNLRPVVLDAHNPGLYLGGTKLTDAGLARLATFPGLAGLVGLSVEDTAVTDAGLEHLGRFPALRRLGLQNTRVTDAGLVHLRDLKLDHLGLTDCPGVTGSGLVHLRDVPTLRELNLMGSPVRGANLAQLKGARTEILLLGGREVGDAGLEHLPGMPSLRSLTLIDAGLTDAGLAHLRKLPRLAELTLAHNPGVTDAGLEHLAAIPTLTRLSVNGTKVTKAGVEKLAAALPKCEIAWDGGTVGPKK